MIYKHIFRYTQLNDQTILSNISDLCLNSLNVKQFYLTYW